MIAIVTWAFIFAASIEDKSALEQGWKAVERVGSPSMYSPDVERYRFGRANICEPEPKGGKLCITDY